MIPVERLHRLRAPDGAALVLTELDFDADRGRGAQVEGSRREASRSDFAAVLLHGFAQNRSAYLEGPLPAALHREGARVFCAELRGHGRSRAGARFDHGLAQHLADDLPTVLEAACRESGHARALLVGHSMGGILGYAQLARAPSLAGLLTLGAPVRLGRGRPAIRAAATALGPLLRRAPIDAVPMDRLLALIAPIVSAPPSGTPGLLEPFRLANPREADPAAIRRVLRGADPSSRRVLVELCELIERGEPVVAGVHLEEALARADARVLAVVAGRDPFGGRESVAPVLRGAGRREILEWPEAGHVDLTMGPRAAELASRARALALA